MKRIKYLMAWFNLYCGWWLTNPRKQTKMGKIYKEQYEQAKIDLMYD
jgi:hypothetical protein